MKDYRDELIKKQDNEIEELRHLGKIHKEEIAALKAEVERLREALSTLAEWRR